MSEDVRVGSIVRISSIHATWVGPVTSCHFTTVYGDEKDNTRPRGQEKIGEEIAGVYRSREE